MNDLPIKVLLIDDDEEDFILTRYVFDEFKNNQFELEWIDNYTDGLAALKECRHDIFLLDYRLGERTGLELLGEAIDSGCRAPIILLTGQGDKEIDFQAMQAGAADYLVKSELEAPLLERSIRYSLEHAQTLQKFRESEARYRNLVETLPVMFYAVEPTPPYAPIYLSPSFENFGYPLEQWHKNQDMWIKVLHPDDLEWVLSETESAIRDDGETDHEYRIIAADNTVRWVHDRGRFCKDENDNIVFWQGVIIDITERKQAEKSLSENEERYSNLFENTNDIVYVHDLEGNYLSVNKAAERIFGYKHEEITKMNVTQIIAPGDLKLVKQKISEKAADDRRHSTYEIRGIRSDGMLIPLEVNSCGIYEDGVLVAVQGIARDITERKRTEEALRESEAKFRTVAETASDAILTIDGKGKIIFVNAATEKIFGYRADEMIGENLTLIIPKRKREQHRIGMFRYMQKNQKQFHGKRSNFRVCTNKGMKFRLNFHLPNLSVKDEDFLPV